MDMLSDPAMKEIVDDFVDETLGFFEELNDILEDLEDDPKESAKLEKFGQIIDRVMGAARSIGAGEIATFCELGKVIGYKSSQANDIPLREVVVAVLFDALDILKEMVSQLKSGKDNALKDINTEAFGTRLNWLSEKFKNIERASVAYSKEDKEVLAQNSIDDLMASLGL